MHLNHLIVFSDHQGDEADELLEFGLLEGSNRIHPGQGTRNRKFYFNNFFLEIVWLADQEEIKNELTAPTKLWERINHSRNGYSPFGLVLSHTDDTDELFKNSVKYRPEYVAPDRAFEILSHDERPYLPWTCRLPVGDPVSFAGEPTNHPRGMRFLTKVNFGIREKNYQNPFREFFSNKSPIVFDHSDQYLLTLEFDHFEKRQIKCFSSLPLVLKF